MAFFPKFSLPFLPFLPWGESISAVSAETVITMVFIVIGRNLPTLLFLVFKTSPGNTAGKSSDF